jgi:hypothetical protein
MSKEREILKKILMLYREDNSCMSWGVARDIEYLLAQPESLREGLREDLREDLREGISLRDHFACAAMQEFIALNTFKMGLIVTMSYEAADLMLAEREKNEN